LQYCRKLQHIRLNNNEIQSIDSLQNLQELINFSISNNQISDLSALRYLTKIEYLEVSNNQVSEIDFLDNFKKLKNLDISNNRITRISSIKECEALQFLNIAENKIEDIDFLSGGTLLSRLNISKNPIRSVEVLSTLTSLENLTAAYVDFQVSASFQFQSQLKTLILNHCNLKNVDFLSNQKQIEQLKLSNNQISNIDGLENFKQLKSLNLQNNQIIEVIPYQFVKLVAIDLRGNQFRNQLFGDFSRYYTHYTHIFEAIKSVEKASIQDLRQIIATDYLQKNEIETALAIHYFDVSSYHSTISRKLLDVRIYLLKDLSKRNSPFVFNLQQKLLKTLEMHFASTQEERKLKADYLDKILNIEAYKISKPTINSNEFTYFFQYQAKNYPIEFHATLEELLVKEKALFSNAIIPPKNQRKLYERKTTSSDDSSGFAGCIVWLVLMILLGVLMFAGLIPIEVLKAMVFVMGIIKVIVHFASKR
jgi:hypothetical protein